jgi:predicted DNA-binding transcriptional regulator AlpA
MSDALPEKLLTKKQVLEMIPMSHTTLWTKVNSDEIPSPVRLGSHVYWKLTEILAYISSLPRGKGRGPAKEVYAAMSAKAAARFRSGATDVARDLTAPPRPVILPKHLRGKAT